ncbi:MAG: hypothetical protein PHV68_08480, partial [Candidatus Gastranaerophilales bacterium]|nr:hypothetical protein [Candidatus Gastranaerophilales bacterium]
MQILSTNIQKVNQPQALPFVNRKYHFAVNQTIGKDIYFTGGKEYPSGYYTDEEIADAKKYLGKDGWEESIKSNFFDRNKYTWYEWWIEDKDSKDAEYRIREVRKLMVDLNNEKIAEAKRKQAELAKKVQKESIEVVAINILKTKFINPIKEELKGATIKVPNGVMIESGEAPDRKKILQFLKEQTPCRFIEFDHTNDEEATLHRIETELDYSNERFEKSARQ